MARPQMGATRLVPHFDDNRKRREGAGIRRVSRSRFVSKWNVSVSTIVIVSVCVAVPVVFVHNVVSRTTTPIGYPLGVEMEEWSGKVDIHMKKRQYLYAKHKRILHELLEKSEKVNQLIEETGEDTQDPYYKKIKRELVALENDYTNLCSGGAVQDLIKARLNLNYENLSSNQTRELLENPQILREFTERDSTSRQLSLD
ncbi:hypothetical protein AAMO2058_000095900 [Amorphochlora amoebiformis]